MKMESAASTVKTTTYPPESFRVEVDTSPPIESVKDAVTRFGGGLSFFKPISTNIPPHSHHQHQHRREEEEEEEEATVLEKELILKERETLDVLKELETTKRLVQDLKSKQLSSSSSPALILMELKQAKLNLTTTTNDLAHVRASVDSLHNKLHKERLSLDKTRHRLSQNSSKISSLEEQLRQTKLRCPSDITRELHRLSSEAEHFKRMEQAAKSQVLRTISEIEHTKAMITMAQIRLVAARKMKEAATAAEAAALAEINALSKGQSCMEKHDPVTLWSQEYTALISKAREAEEEAKKRVVDAMHEVDEANVSKVEIVKQVEEAEEQVRSSKKVLEEALERVEAANRGKLAAEEALRKHKRRSSTSKFKNSHPRRDSVLLDEAKPVLKPTLSIGQLLSRKLFPFEGQFGGERSSSVSLSLAQMLHPSFENDNGHTPTHFSSLLLSKQQKKKKNKKPLLNLS